MAIGDHRSYKKDKRAIRCEASYQMVVLGEPHRISVGLIDGSDKVRALVYQDADTAEKGPLRPQVNGDIADDVEVSFRSLPIVSSEPRVRV